MLPRSLLVCLALLSADVMAATEEGPSPARGYSPFRYDVPVLEFPYNDHRPYGLHSADWPSMQQALRLTDDFYQVAHWSLGHVLNPDVGGWKGFWHSLGFLGFDLVAVYLPLGDSWVHEEFHRSVMATHGIESYDGVYDLPVGAGEISVYKIRDQDLVALKKDHPTDMVRVAEAGIEGEHQLVLALEKDAFFDDVRNYHRMLYAMIDLNSYAYVTSGSTSDADKLTDDMNKKETTVAERDFVGHDFTSWVYDLFRPDEPYEARGPHPSGVGINRYRKHSDLTSAENDFLSLQGRLQLLNLLDPNLIGRTSFIAGPDTRWNLRMQHYLTSFGYAVDTDGFLRLEDSQWFFTANLFRSEHLTLPGLNAELRRLPVRGIPFVDALSARAHVWSQPAHQRFDDRTQALGALGALSLYSPLLENLDVYLEVERKTAGWVAGNPWTGSQLSTRVGVSGWVF